MSMSIFTNPSAMSASKALNRAGSLLNTTMTHLITGRHINCAAEDASGMHTATRLSTQLRGMEMAKRNANNACSLLQTAEGACEGIKNIAQKMNGLAIQSANQTETVKSRQALQAEFAALQTALQSIMDDTTFGGEKLFGPDGKLAKDMGLPFVGFGTDDIMGVELDKQFNTLNKVLNQGKAAGKTTSGIAGPTTSSAIFDAELSLAEKQKIDAAIADPVKPSIFTSRIGSGIATDPIVERKSKWTRNAADNGYDVKNTTTFGIITTPAAAAIRKSAPLAPTGTPTQDEYTQAAQEAMQGIGEWLDSVTAFRATLGSTINRLQHTVANLDNMQENTDQAVSTIMDADIGKESSALARSEMMKKTSIAMLTKSQKSAADMVSMLLQN